MTPLRARVRDGRLVVDEPTALSEGTVLDLVLDDEADEPGPDEEQALHEALERGLEDAQAGRGVPGDEVIRRLRERG